MISLLLVRGSSIRHTASLLVMVISSVLGSAGPKTKDQAVTWLVLQPKCAVNLLLLWSPIETGSLTSDSEDGLKFHTQMWQKLSSKSQKSFQVLCLFFMVGSVR